VGRSRLQAVRTALTAREWGRLAALFVAVWAAALIYWRAGRVEARWSAHMGTEQGSPGGSGPRP
jgi:hypothetical protein